MKFVKVFVTLKKVRLFLKAAIFLQLIKINPVTKKIFNSLL